MRFAIAAALLLAVSATSVVGEVKTPFELTTDAADQKVMAEVAAAVSNQDSNIKARLDAALAKLPRPTPLRGMVQMLRATVLMNDKEMGPAVAAIEEALRLLPDNPDPKFIATAVFTFSGSPQRAADIWLQASEESPEVARTMDSYLLSTLMGRLTDIGDRARADRIGARLAAIGYSAGLASDRSNAAVAQTREAIRGGNTAAALADATSIANPFDLLTLYVDRRYDVLWPRIAEWAGADLSGQSRRYLEELRGDWTAADDFDTATTYARGLGRFGATEAIVALLGPMLDRPVAAGIEYLAPVVASALETLGRDKEALALLKKVADKSPPDEFGRGLNIDAAYVTLATMRTDWPQVLATADAFLARARGFGEGINRSALVSVTAWRGCALWQLGRREEAERPMAEVLILAALSPAAAMNVHLCRGDTAAARALLIARLADPESRTWALLFVQPERVQMRTPLSRMMAPLEQSVRTAPDVLAAAQRVGRILPQPIGASLPGGFDPYRAPSPKPRVPGAI